ncbi:meiosis-specific serine/threonine-protein kinase mek1 [Pyrenophora tritici-repentis]|nr:meiosis-specific serine/threonine-protein kinase mek1 [Pyrenophora tritici-repentis]
MHGSSIEVCGNEQFYLGRDTALCRYAWYEDLTISRVHLRIHCILYDQDPDSTIAPFVYATDLSANGTYLKRSNLECTASQGPGILMGRNSTFLLDDRDEISISETVTLIYRSKSPLQLMSLTALQEKERQTFASRFLVTGRLLGEGGYGKVLVGINQNTQRQLACKIIRIDKLYNTLAVQNLRLPSGGRQEREPQTKKRWPTRVASCFREFDILKDLTHPNTIALEKVFWSPSTIYIFLELATGGDLFSFINFKGGKLDDTQAATVVHQILKGVEYLHGQGIAHRDLKPDNILMTSFEEDARVVISDFGAARFLPGAKTPSSSQSNKYQRMFSVVGTFEYTAPEIFRLNCAIPADGGYSKSVDMWSIGSITAILLTGDALFIDRSHPEYHTNPKDVIVGLAAVCDLSVLDEDHHPCWMTVGGLPKHFIKNLLVLKEEDRMTASMALAHSWFSENTKKTYARTIAAWKPPKKNIQLVERITSPLPASGISNKTSSHVTTSRHLGDIGSQIRPPNTSLPSIIEDHEPAQCASQVKLSSSKGKATTPHLRSGGQLTHRELQLPQTGVIFGSPGHQISLLKSATPGMDVDDMDDGEDSDCSGESLNRVTNNYSQRREYIRHLQHQEYQSGHGSIQVHQTPFDEYVNYEGRRDEHTVDEVYYQEAQDPENDSVCVQETPPELMRKRGRAYDQALPAYKRRFAIGSSG